MVLREATPEAARRDWRALAPADVRNTREDIVAIVILFVYGDRVVLPV